jgi:hypothetical protein
MPFERRYNISSACFFNLPDKTLIDSFEAFDGTGLKKLIKAQQKCF